MNNTWHGEKKRRAQEPTEHHGFVQRRVCVWLKREMNGLFPENFWMAAGVEKGSGGGREAESLASLASTGSGDTVYTF
jgi:hypothetical protein